MFTPTQAYDDIVQCWTLHTPQRIMLLTLGSHIFRTRSLVFGRSFTSRLGSLIIVLCEVFHSLYKSFLQFIAPLIDKLVLGQKREGAHITLPLGYSTA